MIGLDDSDYVYPDGPCGCGSGKDYGMCCLLSDPRFLAAIEELVKLPASDAPVGRPQRWQADLVTFPLREAPVQAGEAAFLTICPVSKLVLLLAVEPVVSVPKRMDDLALLYGDTLIEAVDGYVNEFPKVLEVREPGLVEPLGSALAVFDVKVECGSDFGTLQTEVTKVLTEIMIGGPASSN